MSQIIRATRSPVVPAQGKMGKVEESGRSYMSDSSMRTKPSIDEPSNMILPSSASSNCRSGISTFLIVPRMSVNWRRRNFTFSRSVRSRICAFVSLGFCAGPWVFAMRRYYNVKTFDRPAASDMLFARRRSRRMKPTAFASLAAAAAVLVALAAHPRAQNAPPFDRAAQTRDFMVLAGRAAEIGVQVIDGNEGVEVQEVRPNSPAEKAGLKKD